MIEEQPTGQQSQIDSMSHKSASSGLLTETTKQNHPDYAIPIQVQDDAVHESYEHDGKTISCWDEFCESIYELFNKKHSDQAVTKEMVDVFSDFQEFLTWKEFALFSVGMIGYMSHLCIRLFYVDDIILSSDLTKRFWFYHESSIMFFFLFVACVVAAAMYSMRGVLEVKGKVDKKERINHPILVAVRHAILVGGLLFLGGYALANAIQYYYDAAQLHQFIEQLGSTTEILKTGYIGIILSLFVSAIAIGCFTYMRQHNTEKTIPNKLWQLFLVFVSVASLMVGLSFAATKAICLNLAISNSSQALIFASFSILTCFVIAGAMGVSQLAAKPPASDEHLQNISAYSLDQTSLSVMTQVLSYIKKVNIPDKFDLFFMIPILGVGGLLGFSIANQIPSTNVGMMLSLLISIVAFVCFGLLYGLDSNKSKAKQNLEREHIEHEAEISDSTQEMPFLKKVICLFLLFLGATNLTSAFSFAATRPLNSDFNVFKSRLLTPILIGMIVLLGTALLVLNYYDFKYLSNERNFYAQHIFSLTLLFAVIGGTATLFIANQIPINLSMEASVKWMAFGVGTVVFAMFLREAACLCKAWVEATKYRAEIEEKNNERLLLDQSSPDVVSDISLDMNAQNQALTIKKSKAYYYNLVEFITRLLCVSLTFACGVTASVLYATDAGLFHQSQTKSLWWLLVVSVVATGIQAALWTARVHMHTKDNNDDVQIAAQNLEKPMTFFEALIKYYFEEDGSHFQIHQGNEMDHKYRNCSKSDMNSFQGIEKVEELPQDSEMKTHVASPEQDEDDERTNGDESVMNPWANSKSF